MDNLTNYTNLNPIDRGKLFKKLKEKSRLSYQEMARKTKKSPAYIVNSVRLLTLPMAVQDGLLGKLISEGHARALLGLKDQRECFETYKTVLKRHASVRLTEELVRLKVKKIDEKITQKKLADLKQLVEKLMEEKVKKITLKRKRHGLEISILLV